MKRTPQSLKSFQMMLKIKLVKKRNENRQYKYQFKLLKKLCYFEIPFDSIKGFSLQYPEQF